MEGLYSHRAELDARKDTVAAGLSWRPAWSGLSDRDCDASLANVVCIEQAPRAEADAGAVSSAPGRQF